MPSDCNVLSCFQQIFENLPSNLPLNFGYFHFFVSSSTFLMTSWLLTFMSAEPSETILLIDRYETRFESHTGGKIRKTLKNNQNFDVFG